MNFFFLALGFHLSNSAEKSTFILSVWCIGDHSQNGGWVGARDANERNANGGFNDTPKISKRPGTKLCTSSV